MANTLYNYVAISTVVDAYCEAHDDSSRERCQKCAQTLALEPDAECWPYSRNLMHPSDHPKFRQLAAKPHREAYYAALTASKLLIVPRDKSRVEGT